MSNSKIETWKGMKTNPANITSFARAKGMWWNNHRPTIQLLLDNDEKYHESALLQMIPCMEKVYALENNLSNKSRVSLAKVAKRFFPDWEEELCDLYRKHVANGLKHDSFVRPHSFSVKSSWGNNERYSFFPVHIAITVTFMHPEYGEQKTLHINKLSFWEKLHPQIDEFYGEMTR